MILPLYRRAGQNLPLGFTLDAGGEKLILVRTKRYWLVVSAVRKSETQVFPTFLFAGTDADNAQRVPYECRFYSWLGILGARERRQP